MLKRFVCPDEKEIDITLCLEKCRLGERCASRPFLRRVAYDREWRGITPSMAGNGPLFIGLKATKDYSVKPTSRVFALMGVAVHEKLSIHSLTYDVLSEENMTDEKVKMIPDLLDESETIPGTYELSDYKTAGSYKVAKWLGLEQTETVLEEVFKSGKRKGQQKTKKHLSFNPELQMKEIRDLQFQLGRYAIAFERKGFPISKIIVDLAPRDGNTYIAKNRGIDFEMKRLEIPRLPDDEVLQYYYNLKKEVDWFFNKGNARFCDEWESWSGRRCQGYCEVSEYCKLEHGRPDGWKGKEL